ncbi:MAG: glycosyl hydrolase [Bacteroidales bacterium]
MERILKSTALMLIFVTTSMVYSQNSIKDIKNSFTNPADENRPWVYWFVMDGNLSKEGITADFEAMQRVGIGGVIFMEANQGVPRGKVDFMSDEWLDLFGHAVREADRLGLEFTMNSGPGWAGSGGPWIDAEHSMLWQVSSKLDVSGEVNTLIPRPEIPVPYFGMESLNDAMKKMRESFYKDICVLAYPKATSNEKISDISEKAIYLRHPYSSYNGAKPFLEMPSADGNYPENGLDPTSVIDVTHFMQPDGKFRWKAPAGEWTVFRFGIVTTGANTRPAPIPGYGFECSKLDTAGFNVHFSNFFAKLISAVGITKKTTARTKGWNMVHIDSWEMGAQNWSYDFQKEFKNRRGYDLIPYLPAYSGVVVKDKLTTYRFLWDMRLTAQELVLQNHAEYFKSIARQYGFGLSMEFYDLNPAADLALGGVADVPMCEFWAENRGFNTTFSCIEAVSLGHTNNKKIVAAEAVTTGPGLSPWQRTPNNLKHEVDWAFACGINRIVFHRYIHQAYMGKFPGLTMGETGMEYERTQTWWEMTTDWHKYLTRCQYMLRQGQAVADILFLTPEGAPTSFEPPASALQHNTWLPDRKGYNFDACDPLELIKNASVKNGKIVFPGGMEYSILVLPNTEYMTVELLTKIKTLIEQGATVMGFAPKKSPSLSGLPKSDNEISNLVAKMWGKSVDGKPVKIGKGTLYPATSEDIKNLEKLVNKAYHNTVYQGFVPPYIHYNSIAKVLAQKGIKEDFTCDKPFRYTHRVLTDGNIYFVSNTDSVVQEAICTFRAKGKSVYLLNPMDGKQYAAQVLNQTGELSTLKIKLNEHGSVFVVFEQQAVSSSLPAMIPDIKTVAEITNPWTVNFDTQWGGPSSVVFNKLIDWSTSSNSGIKYYSGTAKYQTSIDLTAQQAEGITYIDLGNVQVIAKVKINGKELGTVWKSPYLIETTDILKPGSNTIEIEVANLWINRLIGDEWLHEGEKFTWTTYRPYKKTDKLYPSGLIGPVFIKK